MTAVPTSELFPKRYEHFFLFLTERAIKVMCTRATVARTHKGTTVPNLRQEHLGHDTEEKIMIRKNCTARTAFQCDMMHIG